MLADGIGITHMIAQCCFGIGHSQSGMVAEQRVDALQAGMLCVIAENPRNCCRNKENMVKL